MRLLILWAGIVAFVWIAACPPMISHTFPGPSRFNRHRDIHYIETPIERRVDAGRLAGRLAAVVVVTGGLLWTEARRSCRRRKTP